MGCACIVSTDPTAMRDAIRSHYMAAAGTDAATDGIRWYSDAEALIAADAERTGLPVSTVAAVYAACSINASWAANRTIASRWLQYATGERAERPGCLQAVANRCADALSERPSTLEDAERVLAQGGTASDKVCSFVANFHGIADRVTVDRWAIVGAGLAELQPHPKKAGVVMPCATHGKAPTGARYAAVRDAYRDVAAEFGVAPRDLQAVVWVAVRGAAQ